MKIQLEIGDELSWLRDCLEQAIERGLAEVEANGRPEFAAGFYSAAKSLSDDVETRYAAWVAERTASIRSARIVK